MAMCDNVVKVIHARKFSMVFILTVVLLTFLTFLCEQEILRGVCASSSEIDTYGDRIKVRTSDAGIFVGLKKKLELPQAKVEKPVEPTRSSSIKHELYAATSSISISSFINETSNPEKSEDENSVLNKTEDILGILNVSEDVDSPGEGEVKVKVPDEGIDTEKVKGAEKTYYVFKGIPYAQPPLGPLRWKEPQIVDIKSSAQDNTKYRSICSQWSRAERRVVGNQDCLYLNIFTPHIPSPLRRPFLPNPYTVQDTFYQQRHLYPVLIYVHGGDLLEGSGNFYGARKLLMNEDVVLVTFNYRLGIFGFLSSGDEAIPGNYGLLDQIFAVKWVQKYIQRFGGNPTRVTIFGDVGYLLFSPLAVGLFQGAIWLSNSGSMFSPPGNKSLQYNSKEFIQEIGTAAGCREGNEEKPEEMMECLKLKPVDDLIRIQQAQMKFHSFPKRFLPVVDASWREFPVMMDVPEVLMEMGTLIKVPLIAGVNQLEGYDMLLDFTDKIGGYSNLRHVDKVKETLRENLRFVLEEPSPTVYDVMFEAIWKLYFGEPADNNGYHRALSKKLLALFGDVKSHAGFWTLTKKLTRNSKPPAYAYVFSHRNSEFTSYFRDQVEAGNLTTTSFFDIPPWRDMNYVLSHVGGNESLGELEGVTKAKRSIKGTPANMEEVMVKVWTSFANYGTPKQAVSQFENWTRWHRIEPNKVRYYDLSLHPMSMKTSFRNAEAIFWHETLPQLREMALEMDQLQPYSLMFWILIAGLALLLLIILSLLLYCCCLR